MPLLDSFLVDHTKMPAPAVRLAKTMPVVAVAVLKNGKVIKAEKPIKVTIGGCG